MMSNEEWERKMEFLLNQQAKFDSEMIELKAAQAQTERTLDRAAEKISHLGDFIHDGFGVVINLFKDTDEMFRETDANFRDTDAKFRDTDAKFRETDAKFQALAEAQKLTQEELQKLMGRVNRHLSEDHGLEN